MRCPTLRAHLTLEATLKSQARSVGLRCSQPLRSRLPLPLYRTSTPLPTLPYLDLYRGSVGLLWVLHRGCGWHLHAYLARRGRLEAGEAASVRGTDTAKERWSVHACIAQQRACINRTGAQVESEVKSGQVRSSQVKPVQVRSSQVKSGQVRSSQVKSGQARSSQVKPGQARLSQVKSGQVRSSQVKSGQVRSSQVKSSQV